MLFVAEDVSNLGGGSWMQRLGWLLRQDLDDVLRSALSVCLPFAATPSLGK
jgi:hypothetical protein